MKRELTHEEEARKGELERLLENALAVLHITPGKTPAQKRLLDSIRAHQNEYRTLVGRPYFPPEQEDY